MKRALLSSTEPPAVRVHNAKGRGAGVIVCDHASFRVPRALQKTFGVSPRDMARHIAGDIGARDVSLELTRALDMPAVIPGYSRLVVDLNRNPAHPGSIPEESDGTPVPGNKGISAAARKIRLDALFHPYQKAIAEEVKKAKRRAPKPLIIALHSYTPRLKVDGGPRPWHVAVLWNKQEALARRFIAALQKEKPRAKIGENEPYSLKHPLFKGTTIWEHAEQKNLPYLFIEVRQDLIATPAKARAWARVLARAIKAVL